MLMKYYIFRSKYRKEVPNFHAFHQYLQTRRTIEREIAKTKKQTQPAFTKIGLFYLIKPILFSTQPTT